MQLVSNTTPLNNSNEHLNKVHFQEIAHEITPISGNQKPKNTIIIGS